MTASIRKPLVTLFFSAALCATASDQPVDFVRDIRPIFEEHCYGCHGPDKQKSGLRLDVKSAALKGGDYHRPNIDPGKPATSSLLKAIGGEETDFRMPPKGNLLTQDAVAKIRSWIEQGAVWPDGVDAVTLNDPRDHWAFKPVARPLPPKTADDSWARSDIDRFIRHRLEQAGLEPNLETDRITWLRRVTFDLTGLPPTQQEVADFLKDDSKASYEAVVERLLDSKRYGERWAQHWLDLVRYADTHGFEVNTPRPHAWPYRDYVIAALNNDTPYDQFIREQVAGDQYGKQEATGFLVTAAALLPGQIGKDDASKRLARQDELGEILNNVGEAFLGLSIGCARCHDHKFDPITAEDYYELQAFFSGVKYGDVRIVTSDSDHDLEENLAKLAPIEKQISALFPKLNSEQLRPAVSTVANVESFDAVKTKRIRFTIGSTISENKREPCIDEFEIFDTAGHNVALRHVGAKVKASGSRRSTRHDLLFVNDGIYGNSRSWMGNQKGQGWLQFEFASEREIERIVWGRDRLGKFGDRLPESYRIEFTDAAGNWRLLADSTSRKAFDPKQVKRNPFTQTRFKSDESPLTDQLLRERQTIMARLEGNGLVFSGKFVTPESQFLLRRGDPEQPQHEVQPAVLALQMEQEKKTSFTKESDRRKFISDWLASPENPLTARVIVNRIWQWHFGAAIVSTPNDFGNSGAAPSHPELLDWLADEFVRTGWSIKRLHRLIVLSTTYRQSNHVHAKGLQADSGNTLLWRFPTRRLEGEAIRDSMLALGGRLNPKSGGPGFDLFKSRGGLSGFPPIVKFTDEGRRRLIYAHKIRMEREVVFGAFDCPDAGQSTPARKNSTTPIQALNLFNSRFTVDESTALAERLHRQAGSDVSAQVEHLWKLAFSRPPDSKIRTEAEHLARRHGLESLCRAVFNSNEFLFLP